MLSAMSSSDRVARTAECVTIQRQLRSPRDLPTAQEMRTHVVEISAGVHHLVLTFTRRATHRISTQICFGALVECAVGKI